MVFYVLTATSLRYKIIRHKAIMYNDGRQDMVLHLNEEGVFLIPLSSFMAQGRQILKQEEHQCESLQQITDYYVRHAEDKFDYLNNNCEQFVNRFLKEIGENVLFTSPQRDAIIVAVLGAAGILGYYTSKKLGWNLANLIKKTK
ncbi:MAG: hypothetical protein IKM77_12010 [Prevotella sp.]|nr:hypothetical protein [Prevotella sp.]